MSLEEYGKRIAVKDQSSYTTKSIREARNHLEIQAMIADKCTDALQLIRKDFETKTLSRHTRKVLHGSGGKLLLKGYNTGVLIILEMSEKCSQASIGVEPGSIIVVRNSLDIVEST